MQRSFTHILGAHICCLTGELMAQSSFLRLAFGLTMLPIRIMSVIVAETPTCR